MNYCFEWQVPFLRSMPILSGNLNLSKNLKRPKIARQLTTGGGILNLTPGPDVTVHKNLKGSPYTLIIIYQTRSEAWIDKT